MARSKLLISAILFCSLITVSLAVPTTKKEDDATVQASDVVPMTKLTLQPVNRRFPFYPHHLERHVAVIPDGEDDAAVFQGENGDFENPLYHHHRFHHHHHHFYDHHHHHHHDEDSDSDSDSDDDLVDDGNQRSKKMVFRRYNHDGIIEEKALKGFRKHHHHHHHGFDHDHHHGAKSGFMKRVHKFFERFF